MLYNINHLLLDWIDIQNYNSSIYENHPIQLISKKNKNKIKHIPIYSVWIRIRIFYLVYSIWIEFVHSYFRLCSKLVSIYVIHILLTWFANSMWRKEMVLVLQVKVMLCLIVFLSHNLSYCHHGL